MSPLLVAQALHDVKEAELNINSCIWAQISI